MEAGLQRFASVLRLFGLPVSVGEVVDGLAVAGAVGFTDRATLKAALASAMVKDRRDLPVYEWVFDRYFSLSALRRRPGGDGRPHAHDDLHDDADATSVTLSERPSDTPTAGHSHGAPKDIREFFDPEDLASQYNLHQQAEKIDMASMTDEMVLARDADPASPGAGQRVQIETERLAGAASVQGLAPPTGVRVDAQLTLAEQQVLLEWLAQGDDGDPEELAELRRRAAGVIEGLPEMLKAHLERLAAEQRSYERAAGDAEPLLARIEEAERLEMEQVLRRFSRRLGGALTHRKAVAPRGRVDVARTMRSNLRNDGVPFEPVTVAHRTDRPRLVVLADVSLSVRNSARFTLHLVHTMQHLFHRVRTFAFVDDLVEVTEAFREHPLEEALAATFGGLLLDVDANSDYGRSFRRFAEDHSGVVNHRTTLLVLGDARGNGHDPEVRIFEQLSNSARSVVWLTPEPRYSWRLGRCDLPVYEPWCDRIEVCRDMVGLERVASGALSAVTARHRSRAGRGASLNV